MSLSWWSLQNACFAASTAFRAFALKLTTRPFSLISLKKTWAMSVRRIFHAMYFSIADAVCECTKSTSPDGVIVWSLLLPPSASSSSDAVSSHAISRISGEMSNLDWSDSTDASCADKNSEYSFSHAPGELGALIANETALSAIPNVFPSLSTTWYRAPPELLCSTLVIFPMCSRDFSTNSTNVPTANACCWGGLSEEPSCLAKRMTFDGDTLVDENTPEEGVTWNALATVAVETSRVLRARNFISSMIG
mmetsp:Transcript_16626/g.40429  ORF Transcript_16626/g.40429 Transcript_16626/m.40429 type:complete len:250 (-) Transcript_16626:97-846(-)